VRKESLVAPVDRFHSSRGTRPFSPFVVADPLPLEVGPEERSIPPIQRVEVVDDIILSLLSSNGVSADSLRSEGSLLLSSMSSPPPQVSSFPMLDWLA
jgi:hypothetical protein